MFNRRFGKAIVVALILASLLQTGSLPVAAQGGEPGLLFVAPGASGDCQFSTPCGSVIEALSKASGGDRIMLSPGYYGELRLQNINYTENFTQNVSIEAIDGAAVRFRTIFTYEPNITISGVTVDSIVYFHIGSDNNVLADSSIAFGYTTAADNTQWLNNRIAPPVGEDGLQIKGYNGDNAVGTVISGNEIGPAYRLEDSHTDCVQLLGATNTRIIGNYMHECASANVQIGHGAGGTVDGVVIDGNTMHECSPRRTGCDGWHTIITDANVPNVSITNNYLWGSVTVGKVSSGPGEPIIVGNIADSVPCTRNTGVNTLREPCPGIEGPAYSEPPPGLPDGSIVVAPVPTPTEPPVVVVPTPTEQPVVVVPTPTEQPVVVVPTPTETATVEAGVHVMPEVDGIVLDDTSQALHSQRKTYERTVTASSGVIRIDVVVNGAWQDRSWARVQITNAAGVVVGEASAGRTPSLMLELPVTAGVYHLLVFSKPAPDVRTRVVQVVDATPEVPTATPEVPTATPEVPTATPEVPTVEPSPEAGLTFVTTSFTSRIHSQIPALYFDFTTGAGPVDLQFNLAEAWRDRGWAVMTLLDSSGTEIARGVSNEGTSISLQADVAAGPHTIVIQSKSGIVTVDVTHPMS